MVDSTSKKLISQINCGKASESHKRKEILTQKKERSHRASVKWREKLLTNTKHPIHSCILCFTSSTISPNSYSIKQHLDTYTTTQEEVNNLGQHYCPREARQHDE